MSSRILLALTTDFHKLLDGLSDVGSDGTTQVEVLNRSGMNPASVLRAILKGAASHDAVVLDGSVGLRGGYLDLFATALIQHRGNRPFVILSDCTWKRGSWWLDRMACRLGIRLVDGPKVIYCVSSNEEAYMFPATWGIDRDRVKLAPWCHTWSTEELAMETSLDGGLFAGGDSLRDYDLLVKAVSRIDTNVTVATRRKDLKQRQGLPENMTVRSVGHEEYMSMIRNALAVVIPLPPGLERSAGQTTYLNAMAMGKLVVLTDSVGVRDHVEDGVTGLIVPPGDPDGLAATLRWVADASNRAEVRRVAARAREVALTRFSPEAYLRNLVRIASGALKPP